MNAKTREEYTLAMRLLDRICAEQNIAPTDELRQMFWRGVLHGRRRATPNAPRAEQNARARRTAQPKPIRPGSSVSGSGLLRDSRVGSSADLSDSSASRKRGKDLGDGGVFRL